MTVEVTDADVEAVRDACGESSDMKKIIAAACEVMTQKHDLKSATVEKLVQQRDAWRAACRYLYEVIGESGPKGKPMDLISKGDYGRIIAMIGRAETFESDYEK